MKTRILMALGLAALIAACGQKDESNGDATPEQAAALNNAAEMLDTTSDTLTTNDTAVDAGNTTGEAAAIGNEATNAQ